MKKSSLLLLAGVFAATSLAAVDIVKNGKAVSEIVIAADAHTSTLRAAEDLQYFISKISGAKINIVRKPTAGVANQLYVGESSHTRKLGYKMPKFKNSAYDILVAKNYAVLAGPMVIVKRSPFSTLPSDTRYQRAPLTNKSPKPANYPSPGLKKWWDFAGAPFALRNVGPGAGNFNTPLQIHVNDDTGNWYAVSAFLEHLGVRFYAPYEDGTIIPSAKNISVKPMRLSREAAFGRREWTYYSAMNVDKEGVSWLKRLKCGNHTQIIYNHATYGVYSTREQYAKHPEFFAESAPGVKFSGYPAGSGSPRYNDPGFRKASLQFLRKVFDAFPNLSAFAMGPPDGTVLIDYRDMAQYMKKYKNPDQAAANVLWDFNVYLAKGLAESHPGKTLLYMNGAGARSFPTNFRPGEVDNIVKPFAQPYSATRVLDTVNRAVIAERQEWLKKVNGKRKSPVWDYFLYYRTPTFPRYPIIFTASLQREMKEMRPYADGKFIEISPAWMSEGKRGRPDGDRLGMVPLMHLMVYVQNKLFWNPDLDMKKLLDEYYKLYYGPAAKVMKEYYTFAEKVWSRQESRSVTLTTGFLKEKDVPRYFELLAGAKAAVPANSVYFRRIAAIEKALQPLKKLFSNLKRTGALMRAYRVADNAPLDGNLAKYRHGWQNMVDNNTGEFAERLQTRVNAYFSNNRKFIRVAAICYEPNMKGIKAVSTRNDEFKIFDDDVIEVYLDSPERSYFKIAVNTNGAIYDESTDVAIVDRDTLPILWNPGCKAVVKKYADRWEAEIHIPVSDLGKLGPSRQYPWGIQIGRTRMTGKKYRSFSIAPTGGPYRILPKWRNLYVR